MIRAYYALFLAVRLAEEDLRLSCIRYQMFDTMHIR